jgi:hypothetical protein
MDRVCIRQIPLNLLLLRLHRREHRNLDFNHLRPIRVASRLREAWELRVARGLRAARELSPTGRNQRGKEGSVSLKKIRIPCQGMRISAVHFVGGCNRG